MLESRFRPHASEGPCSTFSLLSLFCAHDSFHLLRAGSDVEREEMVLLSVLNQGPGGYMYLVPCTVFQADPSKTFEDLFNTIANGGVRMIAPSGELAEATVERVFVRPYKQVCQ